MQSLFFKEMCRYCRSYAYGVVAVKCGLTAFALQELVLTRTLRFVLINKSDFASYTSQTGKKSSVQADTKVTTAPPKRTTSEILDTNTSISDILDTKGMSEIEFAAHMVSEL